MNKTPLSAKQLAILGYLHNKRRRIPHGCKRISEVAGYDVASILHSLQRRGLVELGKDKNSFTVTWLVQPSQLDTRMIHFRDLTKLQKLFAS